jgi:hypothetical protein
MQWRFMPECDEKSLPGPMEKAYIKRQDKDGRCNITRFPESQHILDPFIFTLKMVVACTSETVAIQG